MHSHPDIVHIPPTNVGERAREDFFSNQRIHQREKELLKKLALTDEPIWRTVRRVVNHYLLTVPKTTMDKKTNDKHASIEQEH